MDADADADSTTAVMVANGGWDRSACVTHDARDTHNARDAHDARYARDALDPSGFRARCG